MEDNFSKFIQFSKVVEKGGKVIVWGISTQQKPDLDKEICDYAAAVPVYQDWRDAALKRTTDAGQDPSMGPIRYQHSIEPAGKAVKLEFNDDDKEIWLGSVPISDEIHEQLKQGFLTGYSQGGSYAWRKCVNCDSPLTLQQANNYCKTCKKDVTVLYGLKRLSEVSYVDSPCSGVGFDYVKNDGSTEFVKFAKRGEPMPLELSTEQIDQIVTAVKKAEAKTKRVAGEALPHENFAWVGDPEKTETWKLPIKFKDEGKTKRHIRNALARFSATKGIPDDKKAEVKAKIVAAAKEHGIDVDDEGNTKAVREFRAAAIAKADSAGLEKGLYQVGRLADVLEMVSWLYENAVVEREIEGDESEVPDELKSVLEHLIDIFIASATEEAKELAAKKADTTKGGSTMTPEEQQKQLDDVQKAAKKTMAAHFAKSAVHHEKLAKVHNDAADAHESAKADVGENGAALAKCHGIQKAFHEKCAKAHESMADHCHKMAESHDKEEAEKVAKAERGADPAPVAKTEPAADDFMAQAVKKAQADLLADPEFMKKVKARQEEALLAGIVDKTVDAEVQKRRETTLAPDGTPIANAAGLRVVHRDADAGTIKLAPTGTSASDGPGI